MKFELTRSGNELLQGDGFFVSFRGTENRPEFLGLLEGLASLVSGNEDMTIPKPETALVTDEDGRRIYRILNGDFRKDYEGLVEQGLNACLTFYDSQSDHKSDWSTPDLEGD